MTMKDEVKNCFTCGNKELAICSLSGYPYIVERQYPSMCGKSFNGWIPKRDPEPQLSLWFWIRKRLGFIEKPKNPLLDYLTGE